MNPSKNFPSVPNPTSAEYVSKHQQFHRQNQSRPSTTNNHPYAAVYVEDRRQSMKHESELADDSPLVDWLSPKSQPQMTAGVISPPPPISTAVCSRCGEKVPVQLLCPWCGFALRRDYVK
eukprot:PhF_6_TR42853/c0_g1_i1/m.64908